MKALVCIVLLFVVELSASGQSVWQGKRSSWLGAENQKNDIGIYNEEYKKFLGNVTTELTSTSEAIKILESAGFNEFKDDAQIQSGAKLYFVNRERAIIAAIIGTKLLTAGSRLIAAHHDSPRIDVKARPLYESSGFALMQTIYYGGIKKYQWANIPLMMTGRIDTKDGRRIDVSLGAKPDDPVFVIADVAPHSDAPLRDRKYTGVFDGEELDPIVGSIPSEKGVLTETMHHIAALYGISEEDFVSAEISFVPAIPPRDAGFDRGLIAAYGQDDRLCSFAALRALADIKSAVELTAIVYLTDNEETGSVNNTGAQSSFLTNTYATIAEAQTSAKFNENATRRALRNALVVSADVNDAINPLFMGLSEPTNAARLGYGISIKRYGRSFDANSEIIAKIRKMLDDNRIPWQTASYKVESGGGGTIGGFMSRENMEVIDVGVPILSMHSTYEISSKIDAWNLYRFFGVFFR
ncbi:aminopeptidase [Ignavibacteria bacterium]|nr:peptidase M18 [Bacteroidota bacterium]MCZ2132675.1 peptidase M18 [Bacteroidota bacterium]